MNEPQTFNFGMKVSKLKTSQLTSEVFKSSPWKKRSDNKMEFETDRHERGLKAV